MDGLQSGFYGPQWTFYGSQTIVHLAQRKFYLAQTTVYGFQSTFYFAQTATDLAQWKFYLLQMVVYGFQWGFYGAHPKFYGFHSAIHRSPPWPGIARGPPSRSFRRFPGPKVVQPTQDQRFDKEIRHGPPAGAQEEGGNLGNDARADDPRGEPPPTLTRP